MSTLEWEPEVSNRVQQGTVRNLPLKARESSLLQTTQVIGEMPAVGKGREAGDTRKLGGSHLRGGHNGIFEPRPMRGQGLRRLEAGILVYLCS